MGGVARHYLYFSGQPRATKGARALQAAGWHVETRPTGDEWLVRVSRSAADPIAVDKQEDELQRLCATLGCVYDGLERGRVGRKTRGLPPHVQDCLRFVPLPCTVEH